MRTNINILKASDFRWMLFALLLSWNTLSGQNDALYFDGDNDYITLSPIQGFAPGSDFTIQMWFTSEATGGNGTCNGDFRRLFALGGAGPNRFEVGECNGTLSVFRSGPGIVQSSINVRDNQWHCISAVRLGAVIDIYYDGVLVPSISALPAAGFVATIFRVGHWAGGGNTPGQDWQGKVDEVKFWGIALPTASLTTCDACVLKGSESGLIAYWQFDEGIANMPNSNITQTPDATPIGNNGVLSSPTLTPPGFTLTNTSGLSNYTASTAPVLYPQYNNTSLLLSDPLQTIALSSICSGDPVHFSIIDPAGNPVQAGGGTTVQWYYSDNCFTAPGPGILITPGSGALFSGFTFVSPPTHPSTSVLPTLCSPNAFVNRCYRAVVTVTDGQNTCTYAVTSVPLRICCPIQNAQINANPMGPLCEGDSPVFGIFLSSNMPQPNPFNNVHINWSVSVGGGPFTPLTGPAYDDQISISYPSQPLVAPNICFKATISNCSCPPVTVQKCIVVDLRPVCGTITGSASPATLMPDPDGNPDHYLICPGNHAALEMATTFTNCIPLWQFSYPNTQPGVWHDMGSSNSNQNTGTLTWSGPAVVPYVWPVGETCILYRIKCNPLTNPSGCPPCYSNEVRICLKQAPPAPAITSVPNPICKNGVSVLSVLVPDPNCSYDWYCNGLYVGSGTSFNATQNACYWVTCNDGCFTVVSNKVCVIVCEPVAVICCPLPICPCDGDPITLSGQEGPCSFGNCGPLTYFWSWTDVNGNQTATTASITSIPFTSGSTYTLTVTDANGCTDTTQTTIVPCPR